MELFTKKELVYPVEDLFGGKVICGVDEAGRGSLAGPLVVAAVVFPPYYRNSSIIDSKKLTPEERRELYALIKEKALDYSIVEISPKEIDRMNILRATIFGMAEAIESISCKFDICLVDGNVTPKISLGDIRSVIKGDSLSLNIAAASILAKVYRDEKMIGYSKLYPEYEFEINKGYGTKKHLAALNEVGASPIHRRTFSPVKSVIYSGLL